MKTPIIILAEKFFLDVFRLINQPIDGSDQLERLQKDLSSHLNNIQAQVEQGNSTVNIGEWQSLKKLLIYWSDEVLTQQFPTWEDFILERKYFGERHRAWKFYVEAEECVSKSSADVAEMFYLAVVLGFVGDLEGAFKHELNKEMPGNRHDPAEARERRRAEDLAAYAPNALERGEHDGAVLEGRAGQERRTRAEVRRGARTG